MTLASLFRSIRADIRRFFFKLTHASEPDRNARLEELAAITAARRKNKKSTARLIEEAKRITTTALRYGI